MCGIIGYASKSNNAKDIVISSLKNLEYRGYDSAGIATAEADGIKLYKEKGKIANLEEKIKNNDIQTNTAIAHTRWATHGKPSDINAHPHKVGKTTLVHNGIIENYLELKEFLEKNNVVFKSTTDSEVACAYINYILEKRLNSSNTENVNKIEVIRDACKYFRGSFGLCIMFDDEKDVIYATRKDSPLVIGLSQDGNFATSDVSAILDYTNKYQLLEYGEYARITNDDVKVYDIDLNIIKKETKTADWSKSQYKKSGYEHFMLKEIHEQPKLVSNLLNDYINNKVNFDVDFSKYNMIHIVACGSAMHAGMVGKYLFENYAKIPVIVEVASEYRYKEQLIDNKTLVIVISQSGETADTLAALRIAKEKGANVLAIVNSIGSTIAREANKTIYTYAGPEIAVATTKGYTTQVCILISLLLDALKQKDLILNQDLNILKSEISTIEEKLEEILNKNEDYLQIARKLQNDDNMFFIGRSIDYALCLEGSLKLKEISYIHSEAYAAGELKHGTISLIEDNTKVIAISTNMGLYEKTVSNIKETKARGAYTIFVTNNHEILNQNDFADEVILIPKVHEFLNPLFVMCVLQLIAYNTALLKGCDIDKPKNLAKSVTVE